MEDIRWKQRFTNFDRAFLLLEATVMQKKLSIAEQAGLIQFFELSFELSWKLMKDYLKAEYGLDPKGPRDSIKLAIQSKLIEQPHEWMEALESRNLTVHTYDEATANKVEKNIRESYYPLLKALHSQFKKKCSD